MDVERFGGRDFVESRSEAGVGDVFGSGDVAGGEFIRAAHVEDGGIRREIRGGDAWIAGGEIGFCQSFGGGNPRFHVIQADADQLPHRVVDLRFVFDDEQDAGVFIDIGTGGDGEFAAGQRGEERALQMLVREGRAVRTEVENGGVLCADPRASSAAVMREGTGSLPSGRSAGPTFVVALHPGEVDAAARAGRGGCFSRTGPRPP